MRGPARQPIPRWPKKHPPRLLFQLFLSSCNRAFNASVGGPSYPSLAHCTTCNELDIFCGPVAPASLRSEIQFRCMPDIYAR